MSCIRCIRHESVCALAFWMAINEKFDGQDRIDCLARDALSFAVLSSIVKLGRPHDTGS